MATCPRCNGTGWIVTHKDGQTIARPCDCRAPSGRSPSLVLPPRAHSWFVNNFSVLENASLKEAKKVASAYIEAFPAVDYGLLFTGPCGVGKSHLAVGILQGIAQTKKSTGLFIDYNDLLYRLHRTLGQGSDTTVDDVMRPILHSGILLLDDLGSAQADNWSLDILYHFINQRYLAKRPILVTTPYDVNHTLVKRVGPSLVSRLQEMCRIVVMEGEDHRREGIQPGYRFS